MHLREGEKANAAKQPPAWNLSDPHSMMMSTVPGLPSLCASPRFGLLSPSASSASARKPLQFTWIWLPFSPVNSSQCFSTRKPPEQVWGFPAILFLFPEGGHARTHSSLAQQTCVSAAGAAASEHNASSEQRSAEALNLLPPLIGSSPDLMSFQTTLQSSAFPRPRLLQACESVGVWEGGSCHCEELFRRVGNYSFPSLLVRICLMYCYTQDVFLTVLW